MNSVTGTFNRQDQQEFEETNVFWTAAKNQDATQIGTLLRKCERRELEIAPSGGNFSGKSALWFIADNIELFSKALFRHPLADVNGTIENSSFYKFINVNLNKVVNSEKGKLSCLPLLYQILEDQSTVNCDVGSGSVNEFTPLQAVCFSLSFIKSPISDILDLYERIINNMIDHKGAVLYDIKGKINLRIFNSVFLRFPNTGIKMLKINPQIDIYAEADVLSKRQPLTLNRLQAAASFRHWSLVWEMLSLNPTAKIHDTYPLHSGRLVGSFFDSLSIIKESEYQSIIEIQKIFTYLALRKLDFNYFHLDKATKDRITSIREVLDRKINIFIEETALRSHNNKQIVAFCENLHESDVESIKEVKGMPITLIREYIKERAFEFLKKSQKKIPLEISQIVIDKYLNRINVLPEKNLGTIQYRLLKELIPCCLNEIVDNNLIVITQELVRPICDKILQFAVNSPLNKQTVLNAIESVLKGKELFTDSGTSVETSDNIKIPGGSDPSDLERFTVTPFVGSASKTALFVPDSIQTAEVPFPGESGLPKTPAGIAVDDIIRYFFKHATEVGYRELRMIDSGEDEKNLPEIRKTDSNFGEPVMDNDYELTQLKKRKTDNDSHPLWDLAMDNDEQVQPEELLAKIGPDEADWSDEYGRTPCLIAAENCDFDLVEKIFDSFPSINLNARSIHNKDYKTILGRLILSREYGKLRRILAKIDSSTIEKLIKENSSFFKLLFTEKLPIIILEILQKVSKIDLDFKINNKHVIEYTLDEYSNTANLWLKFSHNNSGLYENSGNIITVPHHTEWLNVYHALIPYIDNFSINIRPPEYNNKVSLISFIPSTLVGNKEKKNLFDILTKLPNLLNVDNIKALTNKCILLDREVLEFPLLNLAIAVDMCSNLIFPELKDNELRLILNANMKVFKYAACILNKVPACIDNAVVPLDVRRFLAIKSLHLENKYLSNIPERLLNGCIDRMSNENYLEIKLNAIKLTAMTIIRDIVHQIGPVELGSVTNSKFKELYASLTKNRFSIRFGKYITGVESLTVNSDLSEILIRYNRNQFIRHHVSACLDACGRANLTRKPLKSHDVHSSN